MFSRGALAVATVTLALVAPLSTGSATADSPVFPTQEQVDASKGAESDTGRDVGAIEAQLAAANVRSERLATDAAKAVEDYNGARFRLEKAVQDVVAAEAEADAARGQVKRSRTELGRFAAAAYRSGGDLGGLSTFLVASGPRDLISRAAALDSIGHSRHNALEGLRSAQAYAGVLEHRAAVLVEKRRTAARQVAAAKSRAEARLSHQQQVVGQIAEQRSTLVRRLAAARNTTVRLERERQAGLARERAEAARREAQRQAQEAARRAAAERAAAAAKAAEDSRRAAAEAARRADAEAARRADETRRADDERRATEARQQRPDPAPAADPPANSGGSGSGGGGGSGGGAPEPAPPAAPSGDSSSSAAGAEAAIAFARLQLGKPYQWGADGPSSYDCSGLTMSAWSQGGVSLPHYSVAQYEQGAKVSLSDLRRGDLVFFASGSDYRSIYHVGLYIGDGQMIEAPYTGEDVRIGSIWRSSLFGAARP